MSIGGWEAEVDSMMDGSAADMQARGKKGKGGGAGSGDNLFQGLFQALGIGNKPLGTKDAKKGQPTLTSPKVELLNMEGKPNVGEDGLITTPDFAPVNGSPALPIDVFGTPDLGKVAKKTDILSVALKAIGIGL